MFEQSGGSQEGESELEKSSGITQAQGPAQELAVRFEAALLVAERQQRLVEEGLALDPDGEDEGAVAAAAAAAAVANLPLPLPGAPAVRSGSGASASGPAGDADDGAGQGAARPGRGDAASDGGGSSSGGGGAADASRVQICYDFTKGMCTRGDKCKYSHDIATIVHFNSREKGICFDYLRNQCHRGLLCRFSHDLSNIAQQCQAYTSEASGTGTGVPPAPGEAAESGGAAGSGAAAAGAGSAVQPQQRRATSICYDFVKGVCQRGADCRYSHDLSLIARATRGGTGPGAQAVDVCYDFLRGRCNRGLSCKYSHSVAALNPVAMGQGQPGGPTAGQGLLAPNPAAAAAAAAVAALGAPVGPLGVPPPPPPLGAVGAAVGLPLGGVSPAVVAAAAAAAAAAQGHGLSLPGMFPPHLGTATGFAPMGVSDVPRPPPQVPGSLPGDGPFSGLLAAMAQQQQQQQQQRYQAAAAAAAAAAAVQVQRQAAAQRQGAMAVAAAAAAVHHHHHQQQQQQQYQPPQQFAPYHQRESCSGSAGSMDAEGPYEAASSSGSWGASMPPRPPSIGSHMGPQRTASRHQQQQLWPAGLGYPADARIPEGAASAGGPLPPPQPPPPPPASVPPGPAYGVAPHMARAYSAPVAGVPGPEGLPPFGAWGARHSHSGAPHVPMGSHQAQFGSAGQGAPTALAMPCSAGEADTSQGLLPQAVPLQMRFPPQQQQQQQWPDQVRQPHLGPHYPQPPQPLLPPPQQQRPSFDGERTDQAVSVPLDIPGAKRGAAADTAGAAAASMDAGEAAASAPASVGAQEGGQEGFLGLGRPASGTLPNSLLPLLKEIWKR